MKNTFYVTTPIYYVNGTPHIGHAYTTIAADAITRYKQITGYDTFFATGSDEHGQKIFKAASEEGIDTQEFVDKIVIKFKKLWENLHLNYSGFIRTTDPDHIETVSYFLETLYKKEDIYKGEYEGLYCVPCESFFTEIQAADNLCPDCGRPVEKIKETSYFFKLSKYQDWLIEHIKGQEDLFILPKTRQNEVLSFLENNTLDDLCISRPKNRLEWGITLPFDNDHVTYVWFDALINYVSILGYKKDSDNFKKFWPCDFHLIGKDILRPHSIYWTIMLKAMGLDIPKKIFAHGWWQVEGEKMSKSKGNVVDPESLIEEFGLDAFRYFLLREVPFGGDGTFSRDKIIGRINSELANDFGNLISRSVGMLHKYCDGVVPVFHEDVKNDNDIKIEKNIIQTFELLDLDMVNLQFSVGLTHIWEYISSMNKYVEDSAPWKLNKQEDKRKQLENIMFNLLNSINYISILIYPFMPICSENIREQLDVKTDFINNGEDITEYIKRHIIKSGLSVSKGEILFPKIDD